MGLDGSRGAGLLNEKVKEKKKKTVFSQKQKNVIEMQMFHSFYPSFGKSLFF